MLLLSAATAPAQQQAPRNPKLAAYIDSLYKADQQTATLGDSAAAAYQRAIHTNFPHVKAILEQYGFPGYDLVGKEASEHYWLLVQHSDFEVAFQKKALPLMHQQVMRNNATGKFYAYLADRIEVNEGRKQRYGTQIVMTANGYQPKPLADTTQVAQLRKSIGLNTLAEYLNESNEVFNMLNKGHSQIINGRLVRDSTGQ
ncbi:hypothetical protein GCM10011379_21770 [Filimonas zeae]|uniref:Uncharacterized protein n=2 Tax=Filimonas zeae TaxID=1737353 RepID=A0A917MVN3_9BACT|nr:hypothetical protein GCM10011379_21770 [Filimonas zeae]